MTISEVSELYGLSPDTLRYYERVGMIPPVNRTPSGLRDFTELDCRWVELAKCMRGAGLPVEVMIEYVRLVQQGDRTIEARRDLLVEQRVHLLAQKVAIENMLEKLNYKIGRYEEAVETSVLSWDPEEV
ncbi:MAG: MerR family DNA-binding transcriptional regulator [Acidaminobacter sp.]|uniref:MerR family transcriptional regulator n=1 Tax=Acidaminobacter sp. TaxID=1872102 RepID=UPI00137CF441|nr:MerR family transcriptional regulator [Acidaminobacter sp.]MZQ96273.1 MerR family DNA-binding transcriptional regulator [Acidaminobacter sp.]